MLTQQSNDDTSMIHYRKPVSLTGNHILEWLNVKEYSRIKVLNSLLESNSNDIFYPYLILDSVDRKKLNKNKNILKQ